MIKTLIAGNWKMNGLAGSIAQIETVAAKLKSPSETKSALLCVPATLIHRAAETARESALAIGGETCHPEVSGAHTGDISAEMLADAGASYVIVGHSERRADHGELNGTVASQAKAARRAGIVPIICIGESLEARDAGETLNVIEKQLGASVPGDFENETFVVAYEPIWAIGTGKVATVQQIDEVHNFLRAQLSQRFGDAGSRVQILYGGSMKPANAAEILAVENVNGGLIGGASLKAEDFLSIYETA